MTDRLKGYIVILEENIREDDAQPITDALTMVKGVLKVTPLVSNVNGRIAEVRARQKLVDQLLHILLPAMKGMNRDA